MKLKRLCLLLSISYAGSAAAIGLGDISVRSYLGQPLHVTVALIDATPAPAADCFSIEAGAGGIAPPPKTQLSIEQTGGRTLLHIRTPRSINEPVVQFVLSADCEARLQRDYAVLLDPPPLVAPASVAEAPAQAVRVAAGPAMAHDQAPTPAAAPRPVRRAKRIQASAAPAVAHPVAETRQPAPRSRQTAAATSNPRLVLSGKEGIENEASLPLQPAADLPERSLPAASDPTLTSLSDDNTALNRRIAHLEEQLATLRKRNAELDALRAAKSRHAPPPAPERPRWPLYLLAVGLLAGVGALGTWLGRRKRRPVKRAEALPWEASERLPALPEIERPRNAEPGALPEQPSAAPAAMGDGTEVKEDVLDQAEVYMAHGHADLAIHLLQENLRESPTESPVPWLLLLDLLQRAGDVAGYTAASAECKRHFNINLGSYRASQEGSNGRGLEAYPHLFEQLTEKWNSPEIADFFGNLIYDRRGGTRLGFEPDAYREILLLRAIAEDVLPIAA